MLLQPFLVTFQLSHGEIQWVVYEKSMSVLQERLNQDLADKNIAYIEIDGAILFTRHIQSFGIQRCQA